MITFIVIMILLVVSLKIGLFFSIRGNINQSKEILKLQKEQQQQQVIEQQIRRINDETIQKIKEARNIPDNELVNYLNELQVYPWND